MPPGYMNSKERDPKNFTLAQWQQAKRIGKDPREIKAALQDSWAISDTQGSFQQALKERGYTLARGDRRGFVALDHRCEVFAIPKWAGLKAKDVRTRLTDQEVLPSVEKARMQIAQDMTGRLSLLQQQQQAAIQSRLSDIEEKRLVLVKRQAAERTAQQQAHETHTQTETLQRQERFNKGLRGLFDRVTGKHRQLKEQNERETLQAQIRDRAEKDKLIFQHLDQRRTLHSRMERLQTFKENHAQALSRDRQQYQEISDKKRTVAEFREAMRSGRSRGGPERER